MDSAVFQTSVVPDAAASAGYYNGPADNAAYAAQYRSIITMSSSFKKINCFMKSYIP